MNRSIIDSMKKELDELVQYLKGNRDENQNIPAIAIWTMVTTVGLFTAFYNLFAALGLESILFQTKAESIAVGLFMAGYSVMMIKSITEKRKKEKEPESDLGCLFR